MEAFAFYMFKSVTWISGFALVYFFFLRNERYFAVNRFFLTGGILSSLIFPFITVRYVAELPVALNGQAGAATISGIQEAGTTGINVAGLLLLCIWLAGALFVLLRNVVQVRSVLGAFRKAEVVSTYPVKLIRSSECVTPYSFFSCVIVNPSVTDVETREIVNHEMVHIRQRHWCDLLLSELLCIVQWFNPVIWIYSRFIRQNHEYLADRDALQRTSEPALYMASLLNQIFSSPVIDLGNSFNYSLNKKRFTMMKKINYSPYRKLKVLLVLPVFALVLFAFAKPDYRIVSDEINPVMPEKVLPAVTKEVKGTVLTEDGKPLVGAAVIIKGTTIGTVTDEQGGFKISDVPEDGQLVISYVGFESKVVKPVFGSGMTIKMKEGVVMMESVMVPPPPPPPPPPPTTGNKIITKSDVEGPSPLIVLDGVITETDVSSILPESIGSINVLKGESATLKYGEKGKNGVIEITTKEKMSKEAGIKADPVSKREDVFVVVEEMPQFPGGPEAMNAWISASTKYPGEAYKNKISGRVFVNFIVTSAGKVKDVKVVKSANPLLDAEAVRVISMMPDWKPGHQRGIAVDVRYTVPVEFTLEGLKVLK